ncbi:hypothetical protein D0T49_06000 [Paludibacter sp. 221]|uniref:hypothetical protein n=1 Tax=Paludibacter sp. 221 TaxID=2302939 RepID=UPI0013D7900E|nr:hypothetical protein [Paludibacter sp. 221]NDV46595.1 hypothetical protein [Paludibacter sp. 221]
MKSKPSLAYCIFMDIAGFATYAIPFFGEWIDVIWAPLSAFIFYASFGGKTGKIGSMINLVEELLPGTDFIPTFTLAYIYQTIKEKRDAKHTKQGNTETGFYKKAS